MNGKSRCKILKEIRKKIAEENDIEYVVSECRYKGECSGTCPKCEEELRILEKELEKRRKLGKRVVVTGVALALAGGAVGAGVTSLKEYVHEKVEDIVLKGIVSPDLVIKTEENNLEIDKVLLLSETEIVEKLFAYSRDELKQMWSDYLEESQEDYDIFAVYNQNSKTTLKLVYSEDGTVVHGEVQ